MKRLSLLLIITSFSNLLLAQHPSGIISKEDFLFLEKMTKDVMDSSRIFPGQALPHPFGNNNTGGTLIRPGGRDTYPAFWIRDYAMSLESGFVSHEEQRHILLLTASTQCGQAWITKGGSMVPFGAIPDHIRVDNSFPIYFPGTYDYEEQGVKEFGMVPPYDDQFYFIHMANYYIKSTGDTHLLLKMINGARLIDRLETSFKVPPTKNHHDIVYTNDSFRGVDFGFRDAEELTGELCFTSLLKYRAAKELESMFKQMQEPEKESTYRKIALNIKNTIATTFLNKDGMLLASTGKSGQPDVWATAFAINLQLLEGEHLLKACQYLANGYKKGYLSYKGSIRHVLTNNDFSDKTAWESSLVEKNRYQNGAYWGTPAGWVALAIARVDSIAARQLVKEYINDLRENDFRKGNNYGAPFECFYPPSYTRGPVYLTTVSCPYIVFKSLQPAQKTE